MRAVIEQTGIGDVCRRRISALSKGYKQRVGIAQALLGNPEVIVLDEPTVGLDPLQIIEIRTLIKELGKTHTVLFSSHILSEVQNLCHQILIISHGKLVAFDQPENLERQLRASGEISLTTDAGQEAVQQILSALDHITETAYELQENGLLAVRLRTDCEDLYSVSRSIFLAFAGSRKALMELSLKKPTLEDVFLELTEEGEDGAQKEATP